MERKARRPLSREEQFEIASAMHAAVLDELFRAWNGGSAVFHGGTSLSVARHSARFSEDLDFMIDEEAAASLEKAVRKAERKVRLRMAAAWPGCSVDLRGPKGSEVAQWTFAWSHPSVHGGVRVKAEFLVAPRRLLDSYRSSHVIPTPKGGAVITAAIAVPELASAWADKVKAMATRPAFKWRDVFDLAFISDCMAMEGRPDDGALAEALRATASIYGTEMEDIAAGLEAAEAAGHFEDLAAFEEDMARWFSEADWEMRHSRGVFAAMLAKSRSEARLARALAVPAPGAAP